MTQTIAESKNPRQPDIMDTAGAPVTSPYHLWMGLDVNPESIPDTLKVQEQWVLWKAVPKQGGGMDKVPYQANGRKASSTDPKTWCSFEAALAALHDDDSDYDGIGFCLLPDNQLLTLDFDHVRDAQTGEIKPNVLSAIRYLGSYAELSPSGTGIRVIGFGKLSDRRAITSPVLQGWTSGRYVTITGQRIADCSESVQSFDATRLQEVIEYFAGKQKQEQATASGYLLDTRQVLEIRQALGYIDPDETYDIWLTVGMALHSTGADNAFGLWNEWSQIGPKYDARVMRSKWASFHAGDINLGTLFHLAQERGWVNPATREAKAFEHAIGMSIEEANRRVPEPVILERQSTAVEPFPVRELNEIARWMDLLGGVRVPVMAQQGTLALAATAVARLYTTPQGDPLSMYFGCCGRSVGELRYVQNGIKRAFEAAGLRRMMRQTRMTSPMTIYKSLMRSPSLIYLADDYGGVAAFSKRQPSGLLEHALSVMTQINDGHNIQLDSPEEAGLRAGAAGVDDEQPIIYAPCLTVLALIGNDQLATLMRQSETGRGAVQQMLFAISDDQDVVAQEPQSLDPPHWLPELLLRLRRVSQSTTGTDLNLESIFGGIATTMPQIMTIPFQSSLQPIYAALDAVSDDRRVRSLLLEARATVRRIAGVLAVWRDADAPVVTPELLEWAGHYVRARLIETVDRFDVLHGTDGKASPYSQVLEKLIEQGPDGIPESRIPKFSWLFRNLGGKQRGELIEQMLADQVVVQVTIKPQGRGRPSKRLVAAKFVAQEEFVA